MTNGAENLSILTNPLLNSLSSGTAGAALRTYAFAAAGEPVLKSGYAGGSAVTRDWMNWEKAAFRQVVAVYAEVCGLKFIEVSSTQSSDVDLQMVSKVPGGFAGYAGGSIFVVGAANEALLTHELAHVAGLGHPFDTAFGSALLPGVTSPGSPGQFGLNATGYSILAYREASYTDYPTVKIPVASTLGALDIAVLQALYGANMTTRTGNDAYLAPTGISTIWDAGGTDTIDFSTVKTDCVIDLRAATLQLEAGGGGHPSIVDLSASGLSKSGAYTIAYGVVIENGSSGSGNDSLYGNDVGNILKGSVGNDSLSGFAGNDTLLGGFGADQMLGGTGDDIFYVDNTGDVVIELPGEGTDLVFSSLSFSLRAVSQALEDLTLTGTAKIDGTGNALANQITGNAKDNVLNGTWGNDTLIGLGGNDTFLDDHGADRMVGGWGDDIYTVDDPGDVGVELAGQGTDLVRSSVTFSLRSFGQTLENLSLTGTAAINGTGNGLDNQIIGNAQSNVLNGAWGADRLTGNAGADTFVFDSSLTSGIDRITDFTPGVDDIRLNAAVFGGLSPGALAAAAFNIGPGAHDASDRIIYTWSSGALAFDPDGNGAAAQVQFAFLPTKLWLTAGDFDIV